MCSTECHCGLNFPDTQQYCTRNSAIADKPRDAFRGQSRSPNVSYGFLLVCYSNFVCETHRFSDIRLQECRDLETGLRAYDFVLMFYTNYPVLSRVVSEIFNVEKYCDLEIPAKGQSRSMKVVPFDRLGMVSY